MSIIECGICYSNINPDTSSVKCQNNGNPHHFCQNCLTLFISSNFTDGGNTLQINPDGTINCMLMGGSCHEKIELRSVLTLVDVDLKTRLLENYIMIAHQKQRQPSPGTDVSQRNDDIVSVSRNQVLDLLNLHCPNCQFSFTEFDGCLAVTCPSGYGCGGHFCGICFEYCGMGRDSFAATHRHAIQVHNTMYLQAKQLVPHHQLYRAKRIRDYFTRKEFSLQVITEIFQPIEKNLKDVIGDHFYHILKTNGDLPDKMSVGELNPTIDAVRPREVRLGDPRDGWPVPYQQLRDTHGTQVVAPVPQNGATRAATPVRITPTTTVQQPVMTPSGRPNPVQRPSTTGVRPTVSKQSILNATMSTVPNHPVQPTVSKFMLLSKHEPKSEPPGTIFLEEISRLLLVNNLSYETYNQLELLAVYILHLQSHIPVPLQRHEQEFINKVIGWCENGMSDQLILLFQQELVKKLSTNVLIPYLRGEENYDARLFTMLQTRDPHRVTQILAPIKNWGGGQAAS